MKREKKDMMQRSLVFNNKRRSVHQSIKWALLENKTNWGRKYMNFILEYDHLEQDL